ncbi:MAG: hypothetical protein K1W36_00600 [Lachnospiraceae bacterium]
MNNELNSFGKILMNDVRDTTIESFDNMINGTMKGITAENVQEKIREFSDGQIDVVKWMIPQVVDLCLHNILWMVEQEEDITLSFKEINLKDESDGLSGELYTEDGWIQKYSLQRYEEI